MEIASKTKTIQSCFRECLYDVPNFQRPYSWQEDQLEDYWNDVALARGDFFFGTTVTWISQERSLFSNTYSLIDGQQRLTTSAIALSVIRDYFGLLADSPTHELSDDDKTVLAQQKATTQGYLVVKDDDSVEHPVITRPEDMFWEVVQKPGSIPSGATWDVSAKLVGSARKFFEENVTAEVNALASLADKINELKALRSNMLQARVIQVEVNSEEDAFLIFETLNTRGADLNLADLIKNMLVRGISDHPRDRDAVAKRWQNMVNDVTGYGHNPEAINRFIWQSWNSRRDAVKEPELYKALKNAVSEGTIANHDYLHELEIDSTIFRHLDSGPSDFPQRERGVRQALAVPEVQDSIRALTIFNVSVANSAVIALVRKFNRTNLITERQLKRALRSIENFHFQFTAMANSGSTGGTRGRYNRFSVTLEEATTKARVSDAVDSFIARLAGSLPARDVVASGFKELAYAPDLKLTSARRARGSGDLIRYVMVTIAKQLGNLPLQQDATGWTIEHIVPQRSAVDSNSFDDPVYSIGNLALLSSKTNSELSDGPFQAKKAHLAKSGFPRDEKLNEWISGDPGFEPTVSDIAARAKILAASRSTLLGQWVKDHFKVRTRSCTTLLGDSARFIGAGGSGSVLSAPPSCSGM